MNTNTVQVLQKIYKENHSARVVLDHLGSRERNWKETTVDRIYANVRINSEISRGEVIEVFKKLGALGYGEFKTGRRGLRSRFIWSSQMTTVGQAAAGDSVEVADIESDPDISEEPSEMSAHRFKLRQELFVNFDLPSDLTEQEAKRLGAFIATLPIG